MSRRLRISAITWLTCVALGACDGDGKNRDREEGDGGSLFDGSLGGDGDGDGDGDRGDAQTGSGADGGPSGGGNDASSSVLPDAGLPFPVNPQGQVLCDGVPCACSDGDDDDADGLVDLADPECVSSWDNDESSLATGISGDNRDYACQDCFFDGNSGSGNDGCYLPSSCLTEGNDSSGQGRCSSCEQTEECKNFCKSYTPNGCDCFGCCTVHLADGSTVNVALGNGCNIDGNTVEGCTSCVPNDSCINECGRCELCPGKTPADLPADCYAPPVGSDGGPGDPGSSDGGVVTPPPAYTCDDGEQRCGAGLPGCPQGSACEFGCCVLLPIIL